jgi:hypothetical protein
LGSKVLLGDGSNQPLERPFDPPRLLGSRSDFAPDRDDAQHPFPSFLCDRGHPDSFLQDKIFFGGAR